LKNENVFMQQKMNKVHKIWVKNSVMTEKTVKSLHKVQKNY